MKFKEIYEGDNEQSYEWTFLQFFLALNYNAVLVGPKI